jgi:hypothetical protein
VRTPILEIAPGMRAAACDDVTALARQYGPAVFRAAWRVLGVRAAAEDVQQQVFLRLIESPPRNVESWPAYLTTMGGNPTNRKIPPPKMPSVPKPVASCARRWRGSIPATRRVSCCDICTDSRRRRSASRSGFRKTTSVSASIAPARRSRQCRPRSRTDEHSRSRFEPVGGPRAG